MDVLSLSTHRPYRQRQDRKKVPSPTHANKMFTAETKKNTHDALQQRGPVDNVGHWLISGFSGCIY